MVNTENGIKESYIVNDSKYTVQWCGMENAICSGDYSRSAHVTSHVTNTHLTRGSVSQKENETTTHTHTCLLFYKYDV